MCRTQILTRWLYCVECPQYSTRRRSASDIHRSGMLLKQVGMERPSNIIISLNRKIFFELLRIFHSLLVN